MIDRCDDRVHSQSPHEALPDGAVHVSFTILLRCEIIKSVFTRRIVLIIILFGFIVAVRKHVTL